MATKEEVLAQETFKEEGFEVDRRVYYTLIGNSKHPNHSEVQAQRNSRAIALLVKILRDKGTITEEGLDEFLFHIVR